MELYLHNTQTGKKEPFIPLKNGEVTMYNCGPTVYNFAHIGNLRAYVFADTLRRTFEYNGYKVKQVMNITDVGHLVSDGDDGEDKMTKALKREGKVLTLEAMKEVADFYTEAFKKDLSLLNIEMPHAMPKASEHIKEDIELILELEKKDIAYRISDGIYFDTSKFPEYGKLGNINLEGLKEGARVEVKSEKRNGIDFSLWKFDPAIGWESPWGRGFPGWHIECSAMARKYLGQPFDIHTGGIDHIPVHHNNEIAQSEAAYDAPFARYWMHNAHLHIASGKMAKSGEGFLTLKSLAEKEISPLAYRYYLLGARYSSSMDFSFEALEAAEKAYKVLIEFFAKLETSEEKKSSTPDDGAKYAEAFQSAINDDLNTAKAIAILSEVHHDAEISPKRKLELLKMFDTVLGLDMKNQAEKLLSKNSDIPEVIMSMKKEYDAARSAKNYAASDKLRGDILDKGFKIEDSQAGSTVKPI